MIAMLDTSEDLSTCEAELGCASEQLLMPSTFRLRQRSDAMFCIDNGAFGNFDAKTFRALLAREYAVRGQCRFVAVPDVVGDARRTLEVFEHWHTELWFWKLALVAQDGLEHLTVPWSRIHAIFIGGTTAWKLSVHASAVIRAAKAMGKWVHVGRVNTPARFEYFEALGVDSIDGTGLARFSWMRKDIFNRIHEPQLFAKDGVPNGDGNSVAC